MIPQTINAMRQNKRLHVIVFCFSDEQVDEMALYATAYINLCVMGPKNYNRWN